jgi:predicted RNA-binding protein with PUA-like domain
MPAHWLVKQEPTKYPFSQLQKDKVTRWDGVRNYQARNNLRTMKKGDQVLYYHSVEGKAIVGLCVVSREAYPDPTADEGDWSVVDLRAVRAFPRPVSLELIKTTPSLKNIALLKQSRLSVMPVTSAEFTTLLKLGGAA